MIQKTSATCGSLFTARTPSVDRANALEEALGRNEVGVAQGFPAARIEDDDRRQATHAETLERGAHLGILVVRRVDAHRDETAELDTDGRRRERRLVELLAGAAPRRREIDDHRLTLAQRPRGRRIDVALLPCERLGWLHEPEHEGEQPAARERETEPFGDFDADDRIGKLTVHGAEPEPEDDRGRGGTEQ